MLSTHKKNMQMKFVARYFKVENYRIEFAAQADTMPKAVALAAYHVLAGKEWV